MKKLLELYRKLEEWELEEVHIDFGHIHIETNNYTAYVFVPTIIGLLFLFSYLIEEVVFIIVLFL